jgi:type I restriction enzyme R subunit
LKDKDVAKAFFGLTFESLNKYIEDDLVRREISVQSAIQIDDFIRDAVIDQGTPVIDWQNKSNITGKLLIEIGDYLIDEIREKYQVNMTFNEIDEIALKCIDVAKVRYK